MILLAAVVGWILAAALAGLWLGERGRRLDAQRREGIIAVDRPAPARSITPAGATPSAMARDMEEEKKKYVDDAVAEGYRPEEAAADWDRMMAQVSIDQPQSWNEQY